MAQDLTDDEMNGADQLAWKMYAKKWTAATLPSLP
jgi:hypothetical protein